MQRVGKKNPDHSRYCKSMIDLRDWGSVYADFIEVTQFFHYDVLRIALYAEVYLEGQQVSLLDGPSLSAVSNGEK